MFFVIAYLIFFIIAFKYKTTHYKTQWIQLGYFTLRNYETPTCFFFIFINSFVVKFSCLFRPSLFLKSIHPKPFALMSFCNVI